MNLLKKSIVCLAAFGVISCSKVPVTGRKQVNILPESQLVDMGFQQYRAFLQQNPAVPVNDGRAQMVKNAGQRISVAVEQFMRSKGQGARIKDYKWEFNLVNDSAANAWCMPGGKVVVYSGLLPITQDEAGLAVVMGHEIAHAIARHGNERMSQMLLVQAGGIGLSVLLRDKPQQAQNIFLQSYGIGSTLGVLAYSRTHETEADKLGLVFMAMAGYDPQQAIPFWQRMASKGGPKPPQIISTHPSDETRVAEIKKFMPTALGYYKKAGKSPMVKR